MYGALPGIIQIELDSEREEDLRSYVETYLEEEIRAEAEVRDLGKFGRFLELASIESGNTINFSSISREIGTSHPTIASYFQILEDCLIVERVDPITKSQSRKKLTKSSKWLFFDLGVRRMCAREGTQPNKEHLGHLFEQWVGHELIRLMCQKFPRNRLRFWRDPDGPEVDWVMETDHGYIPIEVKWSEQPQEKAARHLTVFLEEYKQDCVGVGYVVCRTPRRYLIGSHITAVGWQELADILNAKD